MTVGARVVESNGRQLRDRARSFRAICGFCLIGGLVRCCRLGILISLIFFSFAANSAEERELAVKALDRVLFLVSRDTASYRQIVTAGRYVLPEGADITTIDISAEPQKLHEQLQGISAQLVVTVGTAAAERLYKELYASKTVDQYPHTVLSTLLTRSAFESFSERYPSIRSKGGPAVIAQFIDQPLSMQLHLAQLLQPSVKNIGVMLGPTSAVSQSQLMQLENQLKVNIAQVTVAVKDNPIRQLEPALQANEIFVPTADSRQFNLATSRWVLQLSYRYRRPVVAYSASYVDAGAVAGVYTSAGDVASQVANTLKSWIENGFPVLGYQAPPEQFSLKFNSAAAAALGINLADENYYRRELTRRAGGSNEDR